jgi:hypothetical protein
MKTYVLTFKTEADYLDLEYPDYFYLHAFPEIDIANGIVRNEIEIECQVLDFKEKE